MTIEATARPTLTACELNVGDEVAFRLADGSSRTIRVESTRARLHYTTLTDPEAHPLSPEFGARSVLRMHCVLDVEDRSVELVRWVGSQQSFYEPWVVMGVRIWLDAVDDLFELLTETHGECRPRRTVRLALQDASSRICPVLLHPWCPLPKARLRIGQCYDGNDCWLGPYFGAEAHGGLDINHQAGTPIWTPIAIDEHGLFNSLAAGDTNNRWRGFHRWDDGSEWILQVHHVIAVHPPAEKPVAAGAHLADGAGVAVGAHEHSHFQFAVVEPGASHAEAIRLDPWILFWQMYQDRNATAAPSARFDEKGLLRI